MGKEIKTDPQNELGTEAAINHDMSVGSKTTQRIELARYVVRAIEEIDVEVGRGLVEGRTKREIKRTIRVSDVEVEEGEENAKTNNKAEGKKTRKEKNDKKLEKLKQEFLMAKVDRDMFGVVKGMFHQNGKVHNFS